MADNVLVSIAYDAVIDYFFDTKAFEDRIVNAKEVSNIYKIKGGDFNNLKQELAKKDVFLYLYTRLNKKRLCKHCGKIFSYLCFNGRRLHCASCEEDFRITNEFKRFCRDKNRKSKIRKISDGSVNAASLRELIEKQEYLCVYCQKSLRIEKHLDHIHPVSKGGLHTIKNVQYLCPHCNLVKTDKIYA